MKRLLLCMLFPGIFCQAFSQQLPQYTQHMFNKLAINPAVAGSAEYVNMGISHRSQWSGFEGAPRTQILYAHGKINNKNYGFGGYIYNDKTGPVSNTGLSISYAYHLRVGENSKIAMGLAGSAGQFSVNGNEIKLDDETDELIDLNTISSTLVPEVAAGIYYYGSYFYSGVSVMHITQNKIDVFKNLGTNGISPFSRHYYGIAGLNLQIDEDFYLLPALMVNSVANNPTQADLNLSLRITDFQFGMSYRSNDAIALLFNVLLLDFVQVSYSYDIQTSALSQNSNGSHEFMLRYKLFTSELSKKQYLLKRNTALN